LINFKDLDYLVTKNGVISDRGGARRAAVKQERSHNTRVPIKALLVNQGSTE